MKRRRGTCRGAPRVAMLATFLVTSAAAAQPRPASSADALFDRAKLLADAGQMSAACPLFAESYKLDPTAVGVLFYMGACHEITGKIASAWTTFREARDAAERARQPDRVRIADARIAALEPRLPRLRLVLPKEAVEQGWTIRRDDVVLSPALWETEIPVDPGMCRIEVLAPSHRPYATTALLLEGATTKVVIAPLEPDTIQLRGIPAPSAPPPPDRPAPAHAESPEWSPMRTTALAFGAAGVVGVAIGTGFGVAAAADWSDAGDHCEESRTPWRCDAVGVEAHDAASAEAGVSTAAFVIGGAALATGTVLWILSARRDDAPASDLALAGGPGDLGVAVRRRF